MLRKANKQKATRKTYNYRRRCPTNTHQLLVVPSSLLTKHQHVLLLSTSPGDVPVTKPLPHHLLVDAVAPSKLRLHPVLPRPRLLLRGVLQLVLELLLLVVAHLTARRNPAAPHPALVGLDMDTLSPSQATLPPESSILSRNF
eukprot:9282400-Pyramimonas_sp.AAC.1